MAPVELLDVTPGEAVLDLCAAPGGKSTQIAAKLRGTGMLVSNDLNADRTKALAKNIELYGVRNAVVLNEHPDRIAEKFPAFFDKILIDAPCSGEGMFRKDEAMIKEWDGDSPLKYADMQRGILRAAATMLRPGGRIVYSTCTFSPEENEGMIAEFVAGHPEFRVLPVGGTGSFAAGETDWLKEQGSGFGHIPDQVWEQVRGTARLWPHRIEGEGHFLAVLQHEVDPKSAAAAERARDTLLSSTAPAESADRPKGKERPTRNVKPVKGKPPKKVRGTRAKPHQRPRMKLSSANISLASCRGPYGRLRLPYLSIAAAAKPSRRAEGRPPGLVHGRCQERPLRSGPSAGDGAASR